MIGFCHTAYQMFEILYYPIVWILGHITLLFMNACLGYHHLCGQILNTFSVRLLKKKLPCYLVDMRCWLEPTKDSYKEFDRDGERGGTIDQKIEIIKSWVCVERFYNHKDGWVEEI